MSGFGGCRLEGLGALGLQGFRLSGFGGCRFEGLGALGLHGCLGSRFGIWGGGG